MFLVLFTRVNRPISSWNRSGIAVRLETAESMARRMRRAGFKAVIRKV